MIPYFSHLLRTFRMLCDDGPRTSHWQLDPGAPETQVHAARHISGISSSELHQQLAPQLAFAIQNTEITPLCQNFGTTSLKNTQSFGQLMPKSSQVFQNHPHLLRCLLPLHLPISATGAPPTIPVPGASSVLRCRWQRPLAVMRCLALGITLPSPSPRWVGNRPKRDASIGSMVDLGGLVIGSMYIYIYSI